MKIIIAGAGEVGTHLAKMLSQENQDIILMDPNEERLNFSLSNVEILPIVGNPTSPKDLEEAGIRKTDLFVSVTPEETTNVAACLLAHNLGAHRTLARINNYEYLLPKNKELFERLGISSMIYPEMLAAKEIVSAVRRPWTRQYWELFGGALILIGAKIRENSRLVNRMLAELRSTSWPSSAGTRPSSPAAWTTSRRATWCSSPPRARTSRTSVSWRVRKTPR